MTTTVVVPAHNEAETIGNVLLAATGARSITQVVVIADRCDDDTAALSRSFGVDVLEIDAGDKGTAMTMGLERAGGTDTLFLDADVVGLTTAHVDALALAPPPGGMVVGLRAGGNSSGLPPISGERRIPTAFGRSLPLAHAGFRAELVIDVGVARAGLAHRHYRLAGVTNPSRPLRHPLMWADVATYALFHAGALVDYTIQGLATG